MALAGQSVTTPDGTVFRLTWAGSLRIVEMVRGGVVHRVLAGNILHLKLRGGIVHVQLGHASGLGLGPLICLDAMTGAQVPQPLDPDRDLSKEPLLGELADICPTCKVALPKRPQRKTKCKACGAFIYSKRRPQDRAVVLCTESDRVGIEEQWAIVQGLSSRPKYNATRKAHAKSDMEAALALRDWREVSACALDLAKIAEREEDWTTLFDMMSMCLYLTLAGADEHGYQKDPIHRQLGPGSLALFAFACDGLSHGAEAARSRFVQIAVALGVGRQPVPEGLDEFYQATPCASPAEAWTLLAEALRPMMDW